MASSGRSVSVFLTLFPIAFLSLSPATKGVSEIEFESMLSVLRIRGYGLFANAITTSDLRYDILSGDSFTFFAPTDAALFALDMTATAFDYIKTLRYHVVTQRYSLSDLRWIRSGASLRTLVPHLSVTISRRISPEWNVIFVDGIGIAFPGLYYGLDVAVHGLAGILTLQEVPPANNTIISPAPQIANFNVSSVPDLTENRHTFSDGYVLPALPPKLHSSAAVVPSPSSYHSWNVISDNEGESGELPSSRPISPDLIDEDSDETETLDLVPEISRRLDTETVDFPVTHTSQFDL